MSTTRNRLAVLALALAALCAAPAEAEPAMSAADLAKLVQNPLADTIMLPLANDTNFRVGPNRATANVLNVQPVVPFRLNEDWNLITRMTVPVVSQPRLSGQHGAETGLGNLVPILALSPAHPGDVVWGVGPTFMLPTATGKTLGSRNWAAGPAAVMLIQPDPWSLGVLLTHWWSVAGPRSAGRTDRTSLQLFAVYNFPDGSFLSYSPIISADWTRKAGDRVTLPVGGEVGKVFEWGGQAMVASAGAYSNVLHPQQEASWQLRAGLTFIFPQ